MIETITTDTEIIEITTTIRRHKRVIDWEDIETSVEQDDMCEAPWDNCDGFEHDIQWLRYGAEHEDQKNARGYGHCEGHRSYFLITIDDDTVTKRWGCSSPYPGASKQVCREYIAEMKANTIDQLVKWYENGWEWWGAVAKYGDITESVWGIDSYDYAQEMADDEMREQVAHELEKEGYTITNRPETTVYDPKRQHRENVLWRSRYAMGKIKA